MTLSAGFHDRARELIAKYPDGRSALIMLLHDAQDEVGYLSADAIREVAAVMKLTPADVAGVATFYTMFKRRHPGRFLISMCTNISCAVNGSDQTVAALRELIGEPDQTTEDGLCSWESVECLATCHWAPAAQINYLDIPYLTPERAERLITALRDGADLDAALAELRQATSLSQARAAQTTGAES